MDREKKRKQKDKQISTKLYIFSIAELKKKKWGEKTEIDSVFFVMLRFECKERAYLGGSYTHYSYN